MKYVLTLLVTMTALIANAQICGTDYFLEKQYQENPSFQNVVEENWTKSDGPMIQREGNRAVEIIPVVFHVFHDNDNGDISYAQIESAMDMLNEDFRRTNSDASQTRAIFSNFAADSEIEFRLAKIDPNGNCTNGVVRVNDPDAANDAGNGVKGLSYWPSNQYFNIWVVNSIQSGSVNGTILGYAQFPGSGSWTTYGVVVRNDRVGRIGTATSGDRTLTHEVGHCLNLLHTFQSGCGSSCDNTGDRVCDTPPVNSSTQSCNLNQNQCANDTQGNSVYSTDVLDQIENYMSYNDCQNMFSLGQKIRMQNALSNFSTLANLVSDVNLQNTGALIENPGICKAEFESDQRVICAGDAVKFTDLSFFNPTTHAWSFPGGYPANTNIVNPIVTYANPGKYEVSLTVYDSVNNSEVEVKSAYITVISPQNNHLPVQESFESVVSLEDEDWNAFNEDNGFEWSKEFGSSSSGNQSLMANGYNQTGDILIYSPAYDVRNMDKVTVSFKYAYAVNTNGDDSFLRIYVSYDCGKTWKLRFINGGTGLGTTAGSSSPYTNPQASHWVTKNFNIPSTDLASSLRLRIEYEGNNGNNLYIDDININGSLADTVILNSPINGAQGLGSNITLDWKASSTADNYFVQLDTSSTFGSAELQEFTVQYKNGSSVGTDTEQMVSNLDNGTYYWRVRKDTNGVATNWSETWSFSVLVNGINPRDNEILNLSVYPNPASDYVVVELNENESSDAVIELYDMTGKLVEVLYNGRLNQGRNTWRFNRKNWSNGLYIIQVRSNSAVSTVKVVFD